MSDVAQSETAVEQKGTTHEDLSQVGKRSREAAVINGKVAKKLSDALAATGAAPHHAVVHATSSPIEPWEKVKFEDPYTYVYGYGNELSSEALPDAIPKLGNTPMRCPYNLYAEQLSGTSFTTPRVHNRRSWLYKIRPTAAHAPFRPVKKDPRVEEKNASLKPGYESASTSTSTSSSSTEKKRQYDKFERITNDFSKAEINPNQLRWKPFPIPDIKEDGPVDFLEGMITIAGAGDPTMKAGCAIHVYGCNSSMTNSAFQNADGDLLIVPQQTPLIFQTEFGRLRVAPGEFIVIPRGIKFAVQLDAPNGQGAARGYICEVFDGHFIIPDLGPIGANGLANARHFAAPSAAYEVREYSGKDGDVFKYYNKYMGKMFETELSTSPFDVVAWTGNYLPFKYDMAMFNTVNSVSFDHLDPSIFTVLTCQTTSPGVAAIDFVVFPPRMAVQEDTFRPPYYHRNCMSEFMGNIMGQYDAKPEGTKGLSLLYWCRLAYFFPGI